MGLYDPTPLNQFGLYKDCAYCIEWSRGRIVSQFMGSHRILCDPTLILDDSACCKFNSSTLVTYMNMISNSKSLIKQKEESHKNKDHVVLMKDY